MDVPIQQILWADALRIPVFFSR